MNKMTQMIATVAVLATTPAMAGNADNFDGFRLGAVAGADEVIGSVDFTDVVYGVDGGYDVAVSDNVVLGVDASVTNPLEGNRTFSVAGRAGLAITDNVMPYVRAGWTNYRWESNVNLNGLTVGGGVEFALSETAYTKAEYRYNDLARDVGTHIGLVGVGLRF